MSPAQGGGSGAERGDRPRADDQAGRLGVRLHDLALLERALVHRSWAFEQQVPSNERLEFLGDAVLDVVVTDELFHLRPDHTEGRLAELRAAAVSEGSLAGVARGLGLGEFLYLGVGESESGGADKASLLADALEAVIGAVYLDAGYAVAYDLVQRLFAPRLADLLARASVTDPKTALQEHTEATVGELPRYATTGSGPDHRRTFVATVEVAGHCHGRGSGPTKKAAERAAAIQALESLTGESTVATVAVPPVGLAGTRGAGSSG